MKVGDFCKEIGVSNSSLNLFLSQSGNKGSGSNTFFGASRFFTHREVVGLPMPSKAKKQKTSDTGSHQSATTGAATGVDPSLIEIPGQYTGDVAVYDTCDEIRRKMNAHLKREDVTKAQFARDLQALLPAHITTKVQGGQIDAFRNKKGPKAGCTSSVYAVSDNSSEGGSLCCKLI